MSMEVDLSTPLTDEERAYLHMRGRVSDIQRADDANNVTDAPVPAGDGTAPGSEELRKAQLIAELRAMGVDVPEQDGEQDADDETAPPYETWSSADINTEIDRRNEGRTDADKISKAGTVSQRADRLYMDDEKA